MKENKKIEFIIDFLQILIAVLLMTLGLLGLLCIGYKIGSSEAMKDKIEINNNLK